MTEPIFERPLSVELLQWLARASLRQPDILSMAIRLWGILRSLYGGVDDPLYLENLGDRFGYPQWRDGFFPDANTHHRGDAIPEIHHPDCPCTQTITDWLFDPVTGMTPDQWQESFDRHYRVSRAEMDRILYPAEWVYNPASGRTPLQWRNKLKQRYKLSAKDFKPLGRMVRYPERELHKNRPFAASRKTLKKDLKILVELGWLTVETEGEKYRKVARFPTLAISDRHAIEIRDNSGLTGEFVQSDLADFFEHFAQPINHVQRFFLHVEYIIPNQLYSQVYALQTQLKRIWSQTPVPPIRLIYRSAKQFQDEFECRVYPVCICYYKRAPYLFAYGRIPRDDGEIGWYDYRLDRIQSVAEMTWQDDDLPLELKPWQTAPKPPQEVFDLMNEAMGFEFYQPYREMLVWFDPYFYGNYIEGTERASNFKKFSHSQALKWAATTAKRDRLTGEEKQNLQSLLQSRLPSDSYYLIKYRIGDNNVIMRLRAWGANVEVLFPSDLRDKMRSDLEKLWKRYLD
ncbi:MAG TPA: TIGR03985 family CRISPR-associated protein [Oscillatoriales cyanobacterium M59_W2019_021]|nr:TIGR03985 family CRISPR-associated protein [Oscillatoriales cyanobacterium M4454_W2019_049]HIK50010.1 TIGR03985 family CRISPR-associated protein [Oscillatoriales cyanobacterium M59_W2019_021]